MYVFVCLFLSVGIKMNVFEAIMKITVKNKVSFTMDFLSFFLLAYHIHDARLTAIR